MGRLSSESEARVLRVPSARSRGPQLWLLDQDASWSRLRTSLQLCLPEPGLRQGLGSLRAAPSFLGLCPCAQPHWPPMGHISVSSGHSSPAQSCLFPLGPVAWKVASIRSPGDGRAAASSCPSASWAPGTCARVPVDAGPQRMSWPPGSVSRAPCSEQVLA